MFRGLRGMRVHVALLSKEALDAFGLCSDEIEKCDDAKSGRPLWASISMRSVSYEMPSS